MALYGFSLVNYNNPDCKICFFSIPSSVLLVYSCTAATIKGTGLIKKKRRGILVYCSKFYTDSLTGNIFCWNKPCGKHWKCFCLCCFVLFQLHTGQYGNDCCIDAGGSRISVIILPVAENSIYTHTLQKQLYAALSCG